MKKRIILIITAVLFIGVIIAASVLYNDLSDKNIRNNLQLNDNTETREDSMETSEISGKETETTEKNELAAPDFTVYDYDGNAYSLSDFAGKPVIINFWASWCPPCKREMPDFEKAYIEYGDEIVFMMINLADGKRETVANGQAHIDNEGYTFPVYFDTELSANYNYSTGIVPSTFFINAEGNVAGYAVGEIDYDTILRGMEMMYE
jgi:thiol-disulfide isomerase/thioredoxin